jgi:hypothetical protein
MKRSRSSSITRENRVYNPFEDIFPKALNMRDLRKNIKRITRLGKDGTVPCVFNSFITDLYIDDVSFYVQSERFVDTCLGLRFELKNGNQIAGYIASITTKVFNEEMGCKIPPTKGGSWLVMLAIAIGKSVGADYLYLYDMSAVYCEFQQTNLRILRAFQGKFSPWYSDFGFSAPNQEDLRTAMERLNRMKLSDVIFQLSTDYTLKNNKTFLSLLSWNEEQPNVTLGEVMSQTFTKDCKQYLKIYKLLFEDTDDGIWIELGSFITAKPDMFLNL